MVVAVLAPIPSAPLTLAPEANIEEEKLIGARLPNRDGLVVSGLVGIEAEDVFGAVLVLVVPSDEAVAASLFWSKALRRSKKG